MTKSIALMSPMIGEFGWIVFDLQQRARSFFEKYPDHHKIVIAHPSMTEIFELADEILPINLPHEYTPCGRGAEAGPFDNESFYNHIHTMAKEMVKPEVYLKIDYKNKFGNMDGEKKERKFFADSIVDEDEYMTISCRSISPRGAIKNWPPAKYDELVGRVRVEYGLPIYLVGLPEHNYLPDGVKLIKTKNIKDHIALLHNSMMHFGSNTGTSHLALLSECPLVTWGDSDALYNRMVYETNPFSVPVKCLKGTWNPSVDSVYNELKIFCDLL
tara:strand:- start:1119 stop:1934 length:816 start_codon:yes stop_codon:yes gene_type:complete